jgi:hypothetical protein
MGDVKLTEITEAMITAGLRAWFGPDGAFFTAATSPQRFWMRKALEAALHQAPTPRTEDGSRG